MGRKIKHLLGGIKGAFVVLFTFLLLPFARLFLWHKKIWLVTEHGYEARDNGYSFFKYMRTSHKDINCYYALSNDSPDYEKVETLRNIIKFGSFKHLLYFCAARYIISSKTQGFCPSYYLTLFRKYFHLWGKYVFLQHGITKDDQKFLYKKPSKIDLFICGAKPEYDDIKAHYGYKENEVAYTGFARFDDYFDLHPKKQILVMPTWRRYAENTRFKETDYFKTWSSFVNSKEINEILKENGFKLNFYLHPQFKDFFSSFKTDCSNIEILPFRKNDLQPLIRESSIFITDFSSLAFDFGYMERPVIYYQYDEEEYFKGHYIKGYFDYRRDGFGPVCNTKEELLNSLHDIFDKQLVVDKQYRENKNRFFPIYDKDNCERIYLAIKSIRKDKTD